MPTRRKLGWGADYFIDQGQQRSGYFKKKNEANDNEKLVSRTKHTIVLNDCIIYIQFVYINIYMICIIYIQNHYSAQKVTRDYFLLATGRMRKCYGYG